MENRQEDFLKKNVPPKDALKDAPTAAFLKDAWLAIQSAALNRVTINCSAIHIPATDAQAAPSPATAPPATAPLATVSPKTVSPAIGRPERISLQRTLPEKRFLAIHRIFSPRLLRLSRPLL